MTNGSYKNTLKKDLKHKGILTPKSMSMSRVRDLMVLMHLGLKADPLWPMPSQGSPEALLKLQMAPRLIL
jgi:hypothetical protein